MKGEEFFSVRKEFKFEAAHRLPAHPGKCKNLHGHSYKVLVQVSGPLDEETGMVIDFDYLTAAWEPIFKRLDHSFLNESLGASPTTAENIARKIFEEFSENLESFRDKCPEATLDYVTVNETANCSATYSTT